MELMRIRKISKSRRRETHVPLPHPLRRALLFALLHHPGFGRAARRCASGGGEAGGQCVTETLSPSTNLGYLGHGDTWERGSQNQQVAPPFPRVLAGSSRRQAGHQVPATSPSSHQLLTCPRPRPLPGAAVWKCPLLQGCPGPPLSL